MKKLLIVLCLAVVVGVLVFSVKKAAASPERQACVHVGELCGNAADVEQLEKCADGFQKARKAAGDPAVERSLRCIEESKTCAAVAGCTVGGIGVGAMGEFLKGFGSALSP
jgi:hypothetical protein